MQNSMLMFTFHFRSEIPCLGQFGPKNQNCQLKVKLDTQTNSNMLNSMMLFTFFVFDGNRTSQANLVEIVNIYSLRRNLIPRLIPLCRIQWQCFHLFLFQSETLFLGKFGLKCQNCEFKAKFGSQYWYSQIPHRSARVSSTFCRWHMLRFNASYKGEKPFLPILKLQPPLV